MSIPTHGELLAAYDGSLRGVAEMGPHADWQQVGPLWRSVSRRGGFVSYESLAGYDVPRLVHDTVAWFTDRTDVATFEWKTRGHDDLPGLDATLRDAGLLPEDVETVMVGAAALLALDLAVPDGVEVVRIDDDPRRLAQKSALQHAVFGRGPDAVTMAATAGDRIEQWAAVAGDEVVCAGRLELVPGTAFAGLWGGATAPQWRGRGLYRALTAARARSALARGATLLHSDCTEMSRPILQRSGLVAVTTTTPYVWARP